GDDRAYEFQRLHGMGQALYEEVARIPKMRQPCRIYAPVGSHEDLLAYLVRRLLENGANTSFVNRLADDEAPIGEIIADPVEQVQGLNSIPHPRIPLPRDIFAPRLNSKGYAMWDDATRSTMLAEINKVLAKPVKADALISGKPGKGGPVRSITSPHDRGILVGEVAEVDDKAIVQALSDAAKANAAWDSKGGAARA